MGGPAAAHQAVRFCVFDTSRGQREGEEHEKILAFFPAYTPQSEQLATVGLSEGLITFSKVFSPEAPCEVMDADRHKHVFWECEADIWLVMILEKGGSAGLEEGVRDAALQAVLREVYGLFRLFHGPVAALPPAQARQCLSVFLADYFLGPGPHGGWRVPSAAAGLSEANTCQPLLLDRRIHLEALAAMALLETSLAAGAVAGTVLLFQHFLLASTLHPVPSLSGPPSFGGRPPPHCPDRGGP